MTDLSGPLADLDGDPSKDSEPARPKQNRGNRRTGPSKGTHSGRRRGQLAWFKDPLILERVRIVRGLMARGYTIELMLPPVNRYMAEHGAPEVTSWTVEEDIKRARVQMEAEIHGDSIVHLERLGHIHRRSLQVFETTAANSLNRSAYLNTARGAVMDMAKLDGSLVERKESKMEVANLMDLIKQFTEEGRDGRSADD